MVKKIIPKKTIAKMVIKKNPRKVKIVALERVKDTGKFAAELSPKVNPPKKNKK